MLIIYIISDKNKVDILKKNNQYMSNKQIIINVSEYNNFIIDEMIGSIFMNALNDKVSKIIFYSDIEEILRCIKNEYSCLFSEIYKLEFKKNIIEKRLKYKKDIEINLCRVNEFYNKFNDEDEKKEYKSIYELYYEIVKKNGINIEYKIFILSFIGVSFNDYRYINEIIYEVNKGSLHLRDCIYIYKQLKANFYDYIDKKELDKFYYNIINKIKKKFIDNKEKIVDRNNDTYIIMTPQFLGDKHSPTKIVLDIAKDLIEIHKKKVLIISTKELSIESSKRISFYGGKKYNRNEILNGSISITHEGCNIDMIQYKGETIYSNTFNELLSLLYYYKPRAILTVGDYNFIGDALNELIPTITIPLSNIIPMSTASYFIWYGDKNNNYYEEVLRRNINEKRIIFSRRRIREFKQISNVSKLELGISKEKFIVGVVGNRLDEELLNNDEFFKMIVELPDNMEIVVVGNINVDKVKYDFRNKIKFLGLQNDLLSIYDNIDVFLNPPRAGGGISALMALYKLKPVVTLNYGDVYLNCRNDFAVNDLNEMKLELIRLSRDKNYYNSKVSCATKRISYMISGEKELLDHIIDLEI